MSNVLMAGYEVYKNVMQLIIIILGRGSAPPQTHPELIITTRRTKV